MLLDFVSLCITVAKMIPLVLIEQKEMAAIENRRALKTMDLQSNLKTSASAYRYDVPRFFILVNTNCWCPCLALHWGLQSANGTIEL